MPKSIAFGWYGGKFSHLNWLLPLLPRTTHYCEPFGGSAAVLLNRTPSPVETFNDLDGEVVNFFKTLREQKDVLIEAISLTPFSRAEYVQAITPPTAPLTDLERARRFYVRARQVRSGLAQSATPGKWAFCVLSSQGGMANTVSRWLGGVQDLADIAGRLLRVQIEGDSALNVIDRYDTPDTLFYCDPPYPHAARSDRHIYRGEMSDAEHRSLAELLRSTEGKVAISGYRCALMDELYGDWNRIDAPLRPARAGKGKRQEALWVNYGLDSAGQQPVGRQ